MKTMKRLACVVLALVMTLAMGITAFAANPSSGETYNAYMIFDATLSGSGEDAKASYSIAKTSAWLTDVQGYTNKGLTLTESADGTKYVVTTTNDFDAKAFAEYLATKLTGKTADTTTTATSTTVTFTDVADGYYLVSSTLGNVCQLTTGGDLTVVEKNSIPDVEKTVVDADKHVAIGTVVPYTITITDGTGTNKAITLHDKMSTGLTFNKDIVIKVGETAVDSGNYTITYDDNGDTFKIVFTADYVASLAEGSVITVTYSATVNKDAINVNKVTNTATIDYSNQTGTDTSEIDSETNEFQVLKYAADDSTKANLAGATFQLKQGDAVVKLIKISDTEYRVAEANEAGAVETFTTVATGNITIKGVDSDLKYTLTETVAPDGYNLLTDAVEVTVSAENTTVAEIANNAGSTLPTTGGMGTTVLYTIGAALVLGAGVLLVVRRRMSVG